MTIAGIDVSTTESTHTMRTFQKLKIKKQFFSSIYWYFSYFLFTHVIEEEVNVFRAHFRAALQ